MDERKKCEWIDNRRKGKKGKNEGWMEGRTDT
jgi:hypothetical protein